MAKFMLTRANVKDFADWKAGYDAHKHARDAAGLTEKYLLQETDDPNKITLLFEAEDLQRAEEFSNSEDLIEEMEKSGVVGKPEVYFLEG